MDPSVFDNIPIKWACQLGHVNVVKALLKDNRVELDNELIQFVITTLKKKGKLTDEVEVLISVRTWNMY